MTACSLDGVGVLVTRPAERAASLAKAIRHIGGVPTIFPGVEIEPVECAAPDLARRQLADANLVIFASPTAVRFGLPQIIDESVLPDQLRVAAVGQGTAAELRKLGLSRIIAPCKSSGSEALAECPELSHVSGWSVLVVKGEGGNDALEAILKGRGARVSFLECYRRRLPDASFSAIEPLLRDRQIKAWMATSGEILDNLFRLAGENRELLRMTPLFVNHPHVAVRAFSRAVEVIFVTTGGDKGLVAGLSKWFCRHRASMY